MKRDELFQPGTYGSIPLAVLARTDLSAAAKAVYAAIARHLFDDEWVWPSLETIAALAGCDRSTVIRSVAHLREMRLIETRPKGRSTAYRFLAPDRAATPPGMVANRDGSQNATGGRKQRHQSQFATSTSGNLPPEVLQGNTPRSTTPQPPAVAGGFADPVLAASNVTQEAAEFMDQAAVLVGSIDAAHREATGLAMPGNWRRGIRRELANGGGDALALIDARAIRSGRKVVDDQQAAGRPAFFGLRVVLQQVRKRAASAHQRQAIAQQAQQAPQAPTPAESVSEVGSGQAGPRLVRFSAAAMKEAALRHRRRAVR